MQRDQGRPVACNEQTAAGVAIQPMDQFERLARPRRAQRLDHSEAHPAAAMDRDPRGLVDHQHMLVLKYDGAFDELEQAGRRLAGLAARIDAYGRQAHFVARREPVFRVDALAVDAHLALAQQPVNAAAGHGFEMPHEKIIDSLPGLLVGDGAQFYRAFGDMQADRLGDGSIHNLVTSRRLLLRY